MSLHADNYLHDLPDGVLLLRDFVAVYANAAAATLLGHESPAALIGRSVADVVNGEDLALVRERLQAVITEGAPSPPRVLRFVNATGGTVEAEARTARVMVDGQQGLLVLLRDVAERRAAERALATSERRLGMLLQTLGEGVVVQDGRLAIRLWNPAALEILGLTEGQITGRTSFDPRWRSIDETGAGFPGDRHPAALALRHGQPAQTIMGVERPDGTRRWLQVRAVPLTDAGEDRVLVSFADVTGLRAATDAARAASAQMQFVADQTHDLISIRDGAGRFVFANAAHERVLGYPPAQLLGRDGSEFLHPDDITAQRNGVQAVVNDGVVGRAVLRVRHADGSFRTVEAEASPLMGTGADARFVVVARDVTERLAAEEATRQMERLSALGRLAAGAAHDFNNLLTVVRFEAEALERGDSPAARRVASVLDRAVRITTELLSFSQGRHAARTRLVLGSWLSAELPGIATHAGLTSGLVHEIGAEARDAEVEADPAQLADALSALASNARESGSSPLQIALTVEVVTSEGDGPSATRLHPGRYASFTMSDRGRGMSDDVLRHALEPYYTSKPPGIGAGLGLSRAYGLARQHGGTVRLDSVPGAGTRAQLLWPLAAALPEEVVEAEASVSASRSRSHARVLVVDDEELVRRVMAMAIESAGHDVTEAGDARIALQMAETMSFDALVTDVRMPQVSGIDLVSRLIASGHPLPVVLVSGQLDVPLPTAWPASLRRRFLHKPFRPATLLAALTDVLGDR